MTVDMAWVRLERCGFWVPYIYRYLQFLRCLPTFYGLMPRKATGPSALEVLDSEECKADFEKLGPLKAFVPKLLILRQGNRSYIFTDTDKLRAKLKEKGIIAPSK